MLLMFTKNNAKIFVKAQNWSMDILNDAQTVFAVFLF